MVALTINTNLSSLNSQRVLELSRSQLGKSITRLASGVKISGAVRWCRRACPQRKSSFRRPGFETRLQKSE